MWTTTGGHPKSGESSLNGIVIEIKEELGIEVNKNDLVLFKTIKTNDDFVDLYYTKKDIILNIISMQEEKVDNVKWFSMNEITKLIDENKLLQTYINFYYDCLKYLKNSYNNSNNHTNL